MDANIPTMKKEFIFELDKRSQEALYEAAINYISPDFEAMQSLYDVVLEALSRIEVPLFVDEEVAAYTFQALFESRLMEIWLEWLGVQLKAKTNEDVSLSKVDPEEVRGLTGGAIKGQHADRILQGKDGQTKKLIIFGPYKPPVEIIG